MAASSSFKQQCPSCEAMVPIRDPGLIGRKIDCPKCKYRFLVEEPAGEAGDDAKGKKDAKTAVTAKKPAAKAAPAKAAPAKEKAGKGKKDDSGEGGSAMPMLLIGGGVVVLL